MTYLIHHPDIDSPPTQIPERALGAYAARGWVLTDPEHDPFANPPRLPVPPRNASAPEWRTYAVVSGMPYAEAMASTRDDLADKYHPAPAKPDQPKPPTRPAPAGTTTQES